MANITKYSEDVCENIKHFTDEGIEFWYARELQQLLEYSQWRRFNEVIHRAMEACEGSYNAVSEHFASVGKSLPTPEESVKKLEKKSQKRLKEK